MHGNVFTEISTLIALGAAIALIMRLFRQPLIIGHIITGVIAGPSLLNIIHENTSFDGLSNMGVALLLFIIGLDLSVKIFSKLGKVVFITALMQIGTITSLGYFAAKLLGFNYLESLIIGLGLAMSSTIIIVKLLNDKKETTRLYAQITIGVLLLQDVVATIAKIALAAKAEGGGSPETIIFLVSRGIALTGVLYLLSRYVIPKLNRTMEGSKELLLLFALGWGLGFATLYEKAGFSIEIGALFAGVSLASLPYSSSMASRLKPLRDFFLVIFFITLGQTMAPGKLVEVIGVAALLSLIVLVVKPLVVMSTMGKLGYTKRASFKAALAMSQVSEFSLVFTMAAVGAGLIAERAQTTLSLVALLTFATSTYLIKYDDKIYAKLENHLHFFERKVTKLEQRENSHSHPIVLFGYQKGGQEFTKQFAKMSQRFVVVDYDPDIIESLERQQINYLYGDATDPELLDEMNLDHSKLIVSMISDHKTNMELNRWLETHNPSSVFICTAGSADDAAELYEGGASYIMMPHHLGSEKITAFIKKNGFNKTEFKHYREKHLAFLEAHYPTGEEA